MMNLHTPPPSDICYQLDPVGDVGEHVTSVRASCLTKHGNRLRLGRLLIGDVALFGVLMVARVATDTYQIYKRGYTFEVALGIIENRLDPTKPKPRGKKPKTPRTKAVTELPLDTLPLFAPPKVMTLYVTPDMIGVEGVGGKHPVSAVPGILPSECSGVRVVVVQPISLFCESMRLSA